MAEEQGDPAESLGGRRRVRTGVAVVDIGQSSWRKRRSCASETTMTSAKKTYETAEA